MTDGERPTLFRQVWPRALLACLLALLVLARAAPAEEAIAGRLLVAEPELADPNFRRTVVLMLEHGREGALGLVVNRRLARVDLDRLDERLGLDLDVAPNEVEVALHQGGPVEPTRAFVVHSTDVAVESTRQVTEEIAVSSDPSVLARTAEEDGPEAAFLALGYAGWGPGQLEEEISAGAWSVIDAEAELVFDLPAEARWQAAFDRRGIEL